MTLIDRYVMRQFLRVLLWAQVSFAAVFMLVDLFDHVDNFIDDEARLVSIGKYYFFLLPRVVDLTLPVSMLLAALFTMSILSKNQEYTALLSAGQSLTRITRSILLFALVVAAAAGAWKEFVVAPANRHHHDVKEYEIGGGKRDELHAKRNLTYIGQDGRVYVAARFRPRPPTLQSLSVQTFEKGHLVKRIDAARARFEDGAWVLHTGAVRRFVDGREEVKLFATEKLGGVVEPPSEFARRSVKTEDMTWRELSRFAAKVQRSGGDATPYRADMAQKISFPVINFLIVVLGISLGARRRKTTLWSGFGLTLGLAVGYYLFMNFGLQLGRSGAVNVWVSAWAGDVVYAIAGGVLFLRANR
jgi:lipopolysaccharide export system permease protein